MANLTETERTITYGSITGNILAEYHNGKTDKIFVEIEVDGMGVTWSLSHLHGQIKVWDGVQGGFTKDWKIMVALVNIDFMMKLRKEIDSLIIK